MNRAVGVPTRLGTQQSGADQLTHALRRVPRPVWPDLLFLPLATSWPYQPGGRLELQKHHRPNLVDGVNMTYMVGATGFEPATSASRTLRATKLRYAPIKCLLCLLVRTSATVYRNLTEVDLFRGLQLRFTASCKGLRFFTGFHTLRRKKCQPSTHGRKRKRP